MNTFRFCFNLCSKPGIKLFITVLAVIPANLHKTAALVHSVFKTGYSFSASDIDGILRALQGRAATQAHETW